jgi:HEAT repeats
VTEQRKLVVGPLLLVLAVVCAAAGPARAAAADNFVNAQVSTQPAGNLLRTFEALKGAAQGPTWVGYAVPATEGNHACCNDCWNDGARQGACRLEDDHVAFQDKQTSERRPLRLEGSSEIAVLWRLAGMEVSNVRVFSGNCPLDAGSLSVHWLTDVKAAESLALLASFADPPGGGGHDLSSGAVTAIALHADPGADALLEGFAAAGRPFDLRKNALFWMGVARGRRGFEDLRRAARADADPRVREHVMFALTQSREPEAVDVIVASAHDDASPQVRGQALFWLSQKAGQRAVGAIAKAIEDDPETEVKKKAVFALSQLPKDQGVPLLIQQARGSHNREVRKQALFWLGQSGDPRALALFEEILSP